MDRTLIWVLPVLIFLILPKSSSEDENVRKALVQFMEKLSAGHGQNGQNRGWDISSDPCNSTWKGVDCLGSQNVKRIVLNKLNLTGIFDAAAVCTAKSLLVLSLKENNISGVIPDEIGNCKRLSHLYVGGSRFTGDIPDTISQLRSLKRLDVSNNNFSGELPDMSRIPGLLTFFAEKNQLSGAIPDFDFSYLQEFSVANNNFSGPIPDVKSKFGEDSFTVKNLLLDYKNKSKRETIKGVKKGRVVNESKEPSSNSSESRTGGNRSQYSITSAEAGTTSSSLVVLPSPVVKDLKFEDLLRAPAELLGRGKHGSSYKAMLDNATILAVKRMKDLGISAEEFKSRLQRIGQVKHPRVLPPVAFYCSGQEKLLDPRMVKYLTGEADSMLQRVLQRP
ncbi:LRR RECEPTOR-LIKE KINASE [Salix viminalis]|uniref:LRR RECEPTOR-LIKE KINASE n=1 Tax=Salix viminalis TaxID=40686 RepID=A0A9Q0NM87_SALVM|nr:LRR RECEPTOR-LIKE KINASE [Salix viminalis]